MFKSIPLLLIVSTTLYPQQRNLPALAVSDLVGHGISDNEVLTVSEQLRAELLKTRYFRIMERSQMLEILKEQSFQQTGCTSDACAVEVGQLLGVRNIVVGTIGMAGNYTVLTARILDVETGEVTVTENFKAKGGIDEMVEKGVMETAVNLVGSFSSILNKSMFAAAKAENLKELERLLARGGDVNAKNDIGSTLLENVSAGIAPWALPKPNANSFDMAVKLTKYLLANGARVNAKDSLGMTALHWATFNRCPEVVKVLLDSGASVNSISKINGTPLHLAASTGQESVAILFLGMGAKVDARNNEGSTPLHLAATFGNYKVAKLLVENGADVNAKDNDNITPLHFAADSGFVLILNYLIHKGAEINAKDKDGSTPLQYATRSGHNDVAAILKKNGAVR